MILGGKHLLASPLSPPTTTSHLHSPTHRPLQPFTHTLTIWFLAATTCTTLVTTAPPCCHLYHPAPYTRLAPFLHILAALQHCYHTCLYAHLPGALHTAYCHSPFHCAPPRQHATPRILLQHGGVWRQYATAGSFTAHFVWRGTTTSPPVRTRLLAPVATRWGVRMINIKLPTACERVAALTLRDASSHSTVLTLPSLTIGYFRFYQSHLYQWTRQVPLLVVLDPIFGYLNLDVRFHAGPTSHLVPLFWQNRFTVTQFLDKVIRNMQHYRLFNIRGGDISYTVFNAQLLHLRHRKDSSTNRNNASITVLKRHAAAPGWRPRMHAARARGVLAIYAPA